MYNAHDKKEIFRIWSAFTQNCLLERGSVRKDVIESWIRSKNYGVDPFKLNNPILSSKEIDKRRWHRRDLINIAAPYMSNLYNFVKDSGFIVVLTDEDGYVLESLGDNDVISLPVASVRGAARSEMLIGTNAVGTCLYLDKPLQIWAEENFSKCYHDWTCSGAPIHGTEGNIIGCIDLSGYWSKAHPHTLGMVIAAADAIERQMHLKKAYNEISLISNQQKTTLESISEGIIVIDFDETIIQINNCAIKILKANKQIIGSKIFKFIHCNDYFKKIMDKNEIINDTEIKFNMPHGLLNCTLSATPFKNDGGITCGLVIMLKEMLYVHKLVNKMTGSQALFYFSSIIGSSEKFDKSIRLAKIASDSASNVLLLGESGTGKEMFAQSIHNSSLRSECPFIAINCGALPKGLIESELFGYEGGSFTGSRKEGHPGKFELADSGTIFLDEIGDMPLEVQVALLRVLQNKEVVRIGGTKAKKIDVRIIAATNTDLESAIKNRTFRQDLYYRLNVFPIKIPPLRDRIEDIKILVQHFIRKYNKTLSKNIDGVDEKAYETLLHYQWPGNIRELENCIERAVNIVQKSLITLEDLPSYLADNDSVSTPKKIIDRKGNELELIINILNKNNGNIKKSADDLGIGRSTIYRIIKKYCIDFSKYRI